MKNILSLFAFSLSAFGGWGQMDSDEYLFVVQDPRRVVTNPLLGLPIPPAGVMKPSVVVSVSPKEGTPGAKEHRVTLRFVGVDGRTQRQTLTATPGQGGFGAIFDVDALDVLSVDVERVNPPIIRESQ